MRRPFVFQGQEQLLGKHWCMSLATGWTREELHSGRIIHKHFLTTCPLLLYIEEEEPEVCSEEMGGPECLTRT